MSLPVLNRWFDYLGRKGLNGRRSVMGLVGVISAIAVTQAQAVKSTNDVPKVIEYNRDVRPILAENCFTCHGPDSAARKAGLRLDHLEFATAPRKDNRAAIVPGKPEESLLVHRIFESNTNNVMPPAKTEKVLTAREKGILKQWIASGANYQPLWSFIPPVKAALPLVHQRNWTRNPIDYFVLAKLEAAGLKPAPEADRRTLIRRVTLDLTGLPPTVADVEAFVGDKSANAYEKVVDRLLDSPRYGEHRARYWLDAARYADSNGIHFDNYRAMWSYRQWVIEAFNDNESFDQFTIEQLAGDLLPNATIDQQIASGFNRCNITTSEGGAIDDEYYALYARDRTETTSQVWLGLTTGCAVCHDHKYDPISQKEFYSLSAFFNNSTQKAMDGNASNTPPTIEVPQDNERHTYAVLARDESSVESQMNERRVEGRKEFDGMLTNAAADLFAKRLPKDVPVFHALLTENEHKGLTVELTNETREIPMASNAVWKSGIVAAKSFLVSTNELPAIAEAGDFERDQPFSYGAWVYLPKEKDGALFGRMDETNAFRGWDLWLEGGKPGAHLLHAWPEDGIKVVANKAIELKKWTHVFVTYDGSQKAAGVKIYLNGQAQADAVQLDKMKDSIRTTTPLRIGQRSQGSKVANAQLQDFRIYNRALKPEEVRSLAQDVRLSYLLEKPARKRTAPENEELYTGWLDELDPVYRGEETKKATLMREMGDIKSRGTEALVMHEKPEPATAYVLFRGDYDKRRDKVGANVPAALPAMPATYSKDRLGLAQWLMRPENPLPARVTVNRFWQELFGTGLVKTTGDFGVTGELPTHQELLDWLAVDFRETGWDMKRLFKEMVMSATYRQAATVTPDKLAKDGDNRLLSRGPRFRMDAEMIRDYALSASGLLVEKIGGPSVKPYQPSGVWEAVAMLGSNTRLYVQDKGDKLYRRSLYTFWKRAAPPASMEIFNAPSRETCTVRRERGDTPLQALVTLDDPQFVEAARHLAQVALENGGTNAAERLDFMAERLLARPLNAKEKAVTEKVLRDLLADYRSQPKQAEELLKVGESKTDNALDKPTLAAYAMVASELMNLDEVLNK